LFSILVSQLVPLGKMNDAKIKNEMEDGGWKN